MFIKIAIIQFVFKIKSVKVKIFFLKNIKMFDSIKTIFFFIFLIFFFFNSRFLRLLFFVLFFVVSLNSLLSLNFLLFAFFFVVSLSNLSLKNTLFLFSLLLDSCFETKSLKKIANFVDLLTTSLFLFLTKILCLSLTR